jgi:hypothetical protein
MTSTSSTFAMSDRRVPHRYVGDGRSAEPVISEIPRSDHLGFPMRPRCIDEGAACVPICDFGHEIIRDDAPSKDHDRERRLALLVGQLPARLQTIIRCLRQASMRWVRIPVGLLLIVGSLLSILPVFGLWMLPLGLVLLAEDVPLLRRLTGRVLAWIEHRRPHWMGLPQAPQSRAARHQPPQSHSSQSGKQAG